MTDSLYLDSYEYNKFLIHKELIEKDYNVNINLPQFESTTESNFFTTDVFVVTFVGDEKSVENAIVCAQEKIAPEESADFYFPEPLNCIFKNTIWLKIFSKVFDVGIKREPYAQRLCISGSKDCVSVAISEMTMFSIEYDNASKTKCGKNSEIKFPTDLIVPSDVAKWFESIQHLPECSLKMMMSWIKEAFTSSATDTSIDDSVIILNDSQEMDSTEPSILILDVPKTEISVIVISDDDENESYDGNNYNKGKKRKCDHQLGKKKKKKKVNKAQTNSSIPFQQNKNQSAVVSFTTGNKKSVCISSLKSQAATSTSVFCSEDILLLEPNKNKDNRTVSIVNRGISFANRRLRPVVIDGSNVAFQHGAHKDFSCKGIEICIDFFLKRGHKDVVAFLPQYRRRRHYSPVQDQQMLERLEKTQRVVFTPSRFINGKIVTSYDDRFIVKLATENGGVILSNDNYRDLMQEKEEFKKTIEERLLMYCFVGDTLMIPDDPLGKNGPCIEEFLSFPEDSASAS